MATQAQRLCAESLSAYARQFLEMQKPVSEGTL